jgi:hypothetical protein
MVLPTLLKQGTILIHPSFDPLKVLQTIQEYRINGMLVVPTMIYSSLDHLRFGRSLRTCCSAATRSSSAGVNGARSSESCAMSSSGYLILTSASEIFWQPRGKVMTFLGRAE